LLIDAGTGYRGLGKTSCDRCLKSRRGPLGNANQICGE
jgi:hypothetical protein